MADEPNTESTSSSDADDPAVSSVPKSHGRKALCVISAEPDSTSPLDVNESETVGRLPSSKEGDGAASDGDSQETVIAPWVPAANRNTSLKKASSSSSDDCIIIDSSSDDEEAVSKHHCSDAVEKKEVENPETDAESSSSSDETSGESKNSEHESEDCSKSNIIVPTSDDDPFSTSAEDDEDSVESDEETESPKQLTSTPEDSSTATGTLDSAVSDGDKTKSLKHSSRLGSTAKSKSADTVSHASLPKRARRNDDMSKSSQ